MFATVYAEREGRPMVVFLVVWTSVLAFLAAISVGWFIMRPSRDRFGRAAGIVAIALGLFAVTTIWLRL